MCFLRLKHWDGSGWGKLVRWDVNSGAHGVARPTAQGLACGREVSGVFDVFASGRHGRKHCAGGNHARSIGEATPQSACSAGRRSRSATLSTTGGARGQGGFWVGLGEHDCRFQIGYFKMIKALFLGFLMGFGLGMTNDEG